MNILPMCSFPFLSHRTPKTQTKTTIKTTSSYRSALVVAPSSSTEYPDREKVRSESESEIDALLRKARELRAEAQAEEEQLHSTLIEKKLCHDEEMDDAINQIFYPRLQLRKQNQSNANIGHEEPLDYGDKEHIVHRLRQCQFSTEKLKDIVTRLHEREIKARGLQHVETKRYGEVGKHVKFEVVKSPNEDKEELQKVVGLVDRLIAAAAVIDEDYWKEKRVQGEKMKLHHSDIEHWTMGNLAKILKDRADNLGREHSEQFKTRLAEYYEAARRKDIDDDDDDMKKNTHLTP